MRTAYRPAHRPNDSAGSGGRQANSLALAYWIDELIQTGQVEDLASVATMCGVSRASVSQIMEFGIIPVADQDLVLRTTDLPLEPDQN